jgi:hypothetical protein
MPSRLRLAAILAAALPALAAVPAHAVVGGERLRPSSAPWFVGTGICGGTLIAPDRVATAAHCIDPIDYDDVAEISVAGERRRGIRVALPSTWPEQSAGFARDDVAIVQLDRPVSGVRPVPLAAEGSRAPARVRIVGRGQIKAPPPGKDATSGLFPLRHALLRTVGDARCEKTWRRSKSKYAKRFDPASELCATDADGRRPLDSVCAGDSGGPMVSGTLRRPVLQGIISWTGRRCGADRLPTVVADVRHYRAFLTDPAPVWAPVPAGGVVITGEARVGGALRCAAPNWEVAPAAVEYRWLRRVRGKTTFDLRKVAEGATYAPVAADAGKLLECQALGTGPGGRAQAPPGPGSTVRIEG